MMIPLDRATASGHERQQQHLVVPYLVADGRQQQNGRSFPPYSSSAYHSSTNRGDLSAQHLPMMESEPRCLLLAASSAADSAAAKTTTKLQGGGTQNASNNNNFWQTSSSPSSGCSVNSSSTVTNGQQQQRQQERPPPYINYPPSGATTTTVGHGQQQQYYPQHLMGIFQFLIVFLAISEFYYCNVQITVLKCLNLLSSRLLLIFFGHRSVKTAQSDLNLSNLANLWPFSIHFVHIIGVI